MGALTKIQWTDHTFNPWIGCTKVSPGCANCYAEEMMDKRYGKARWGKGQPRVRTSEANWKQPKKWDKEAAQAGERHRVFCASLSDWLDDEVPIEWLANLLKLIHDTNNLDWLLLTKRPENWKARLDGVLQLMSNNGAPDSEDAFWDWLVAWQDGFAPANVWLGTSVEDQTRADERIPELLKVHAKVRFLSVEPMLGPINFPQAAPCGYYCDTDPDGFHAHRVGHGLTGIRWVIFGGESGKEARPCNVEWIRDGVMQCRAAGAAPFVKQLGAFPWHGVVAHETEFLDLTDKKGGDPSEWPEDLRLREFPHV